MSWYTKPVARLVTRMQGSSDGLIIGSLLSGGNSVLEPNTVYELQKCELSGDIILKKVGESAVAKDGERCRDSMLGVSWAMGIQEVLLQAGKHLFLSKKELENLKT
jgi:hypothetical protein